MNECGEAPEAARLGRLAVPPLVISGGAVNSFALSPLLWAGLYRPIHACNASVAHVLHRLLLQHEHLNCQQCNRPLGLGQKLIA